MYALIHNNRIEVGPRQWLWSAFKSYLDSEGLDASALPRQSPTAPVITAQWKILPVVDPPTPDHVYPYEQLAGPFLTINGDVNVTGTWTVVPVPIHITKDHLKGIVTGNRYTVEVQGFKMTIQGQQVTIDTERGSRDIFFQTYLSMADGDTITWKFPETWLELTKAELGQIVFAGKAHIQNAFDWEKQKWAEIDACTTRAEFEAVELRNPLQPIPRMGRLV